MIDEKKLIEYLEALVEFERKKSQESAQIGVFDMATCYGHGEYCYKNAINAAREQPKIGGWIPMEEKLPPDGQKVLLSCKCMMVEYVTVGTIKNGNRGKSYIADEDTFMRSAILAWQPLPNTYCK